MKVYHYTKSNRLNSIFEDGFIATEMKRTTNSINKNTNYVWLTEKETYPKTALPLLPFFPETLLTTHMRYKNVVVDLEKIGAVVGRFYRFGFDSNDPRIEKWFFSKEREYAREKTDWVRMESIANKVGDDVRSFWFAKHDLNLNSFSLEVFENYRWNKLLDNVNVYDLSTDQTSIINQHREISRQKCVELGLPAH